MANTYRMNWHATDPRSGRTGKQIKFGAANDGAAAAVAAEFQNWTTAQNTSLTKKVGGVGGQASYIVGTRYTVNAILSDASGNVWKCSFRNSAFRGGGGDPYQAWTAFFLGVGYVDLAFTVVALSAPPILPNSGNPVTAVTLQIVTKS